MFQEVLASGAFTVSLRNDCYCPGHTKQMLEMSNRYKDRVHAPAASICSMVQFHARCLPLEKDLQNAEKKCSIGTMTA